MNYIFSKQKINICHKMCGNRLLCYFLFIWDLKVSLSEAACSLTNIWKSFVNSWKKKLLHELQENSCQTKWINSKWILWIIYLIGMMISMILSYLSMLNHHKMSPVFVSKIHMSSSLFHLKIELKVWIFELNISFLKSQALFHCLDFCIPIPVLSENHQGGLYQF